MVKMDDAIIKTLAQGLVDRVSQKNWETALIELRKALKQSRLFSYEEIDEGIVKIRGAAYAISTPKTTK